MSPNPTAPSVNPAPAGLASIDPENPWLTPGYPESLMPLLYPEDPWDLAEACGVLHFEGDLRRWSRDPKTRRQRSYQDRVREVVESRYHAAHWQGWKALSAGVLAMPGPDLPAHVLHLLPPHAASVLGSLWGAYQQDLLREVWDQVPEDPRQDWRLTILYPPFPHRDLDPAPVPPLPVEPAPDLWLAWSHPHQGDMVPVLLRSVAAPRPLDALELQHTSGWSQAPTVVECPLALDQAEAEPIIRCLHHRQQGIWGNTAPERE